MKRRLTDRTLQSLKPAPLSKRYEVMDAEAQGLGVRVNDKGRKTFILIARFPGGKHPVRRTLGTYDAMSLAEARDEARRHNTLRRQGVDPREQRKQEQADREASSFAAVAEAYFKDMKRLKLRRAKEVEADIRREFISRWGTRPIAEITRDDIRSVITHTVDSGAFWKAHHLLSYASRLFNWAIENKSKLLKHSPCERMRPAKLIGPKQPRTRILNDGELRTVWKASDRINYPFGPFLRMLILTGQRRTEVAEARWSEIDLTKREWTIPAERMKAGAAHVVPLTDDVLAILKALPRFKHGEYLFSTTLGARPISGFSKMKARLDKAIGEAPPWVLHDIRRTMRTHLSALPVEDLVRELVIGHTQKGLHKVYDQHSYINEKRLALELWEKRLRSVVEPAPDNVVALRG